MNEADNLWGAGRVDEAVARLRTLMDLFPANRIQTRKNLTFGYLMEGRTEEALAEMEALASEGGDSADVAFSRDLRERYRVAGREGVWRGVVAQRDGVNHVGAVAGFATLGQPDSVFAILEREIEARSLVAGLLGLAGEFEAVREDPRYAELRRRVGLPLPPP